MPRKSGYGSNEPMKVSTPAKKKKKKAKKRVGNMNNPISSVRG